MTEIIDLTPRTDHPVTEIIDIDLTHQTVCPLSKIIIGTYISIVRTYIRQTTKHHFEKRCEKRGEKYIHEKRAEKYVKRELKIREKRAEKYVHT